MQVEHVFLSLACSFDRHHKVSCRPVPDEIRPLAAGAAGPAPADPVEQATALTDAVVNGAMGWGMWARAVPVWGEGVAEEGVAMSSRPQLEEEGEDGVGVASVPGTGGGTYAAGGPIVAAPTTLTGTGPQICASSADHC